MLGLRSAPSHLQIERWVSVYATLRLFPWVSEIEDVVGMEEDDMKVRFDEPRHVRYIRFSCRAEIVSPLYFS